MEAFLHQWHLRAGGHILPAAVLTVFVLVIAYVRSARLKALIYSLPVPFSCAYLATGLSINATHITGLGLVVLYNWLVYLLFVGAGFPLLATIVLSALGYFLAGMTLRPLACAPLWLAAAGFLPLWMLASWKYRAQPPTDHRSQTAWWIKAPLVFAIAMVIYNTTSLLAGAVGLFPYAGIFTSYEMRRDLRTLAGQFTINSLGIFLCLLAIAATEPCLPRPLPLLIGWVPAILWPMLGSARGRRCEQAFK